jgi:hypothetical protein
MCSALIGHAQTPTDLPTEDTALPRSVKASAVEDRLRAVVEALKNVEQERSALRQQLRKTQDDPEKKRINAELEQLANRAEELHDSFDELATGGVSIAKFEQKSESTFDWKKEMEDIVRPMFDELKKLTERPRTIERLRSQQAQLSSRLALADRALQTVSTLMQSVDDTAVKGELTDVIAHWRARRDDVDSRLQVVNAQLDRLLAPTEAERFDVSAALQEFVSGRGLNLLLGISIFLACYLLLVAIGRQVSNRVGRGGHRRTGVLGRVGALFFQAVAFSISIFAAMIVLYVRGDWLLLGLLIIFVITSLWALRQSLPGYVAEARVLLNMGNVRDGERVIYNGTPWRITSLNIYSTLHNPLLRGGTVRLTLDEIAQLHSRPFSKEEPWFPTREGDFVILDGDIFGRVLLQTPDVVQLQVVGATTTYSVGDFLAKNPRNLSQDGFAVPVVVGLDYKLQGIILTEVIDKLRAHFEEALQTQPFYAHMTNLIVDFNEAASSSLNVIVVGVFKGEAADQYWDIKRYLQRAGVSACNRYGWEIPFEQLTVHAQWTQAPGNSLPAPVGSP